jgi:hypothetical protein
MVKKRKVYSPEFKAKVALGALKNEETASKRIEGISLNFA